MYWRGVLAQLPGTEGGDLGLPGPDFRSMSFSGNEEDPLLAPLAFNGGPTQTHALKKGSPAINHGSNPDGLTTDQRGTPFARQLGSAVDIGAYERQ